MPKIVISYESNKGEFGVSHQGISGESNISKNLLTDRAMLRRFLYSLLYSTEEDNQELKREELNLVAENFRLPSTVRAVAIEELKRIWKNN